MKQQIVDIVVPNSVLRDSPDHLTYVKGVMLRLGPPRIRAVFMRKRWHALEGSHRTLAAKQLGIPIIIVPMRMDDRMVSDVFYWERYVVVRNIVKTLRQWRFRPVRRLVAVIERTP